MGVCAKAGSLKEAIKKAYENIEKISFENMFYRRDIGSKADR